MASYPNVNAANRYARDVVAGRIPACREVRQACQRHLDDAKAAKSRSYPYRFDREAAERACVFIQLLPHTKGRWARERQLIELEPWQLFIVCCIFGWVKKKTGLRRFSEAYIEVERKNGKSVLAAAIANYMLAADGEYGAEVYCGATTEKQAWEVFRPARLMLMRSPALVSAAGIEIMAKNISIPEDGSRLEPLIGDPGDGSSPSCAVVDEFHEHDKPALYDTMLTGMGARDQPLMFIITTAGFNLAGPCYDKRLQAQQMLNGALPNDELFAIIYTIDTEPTTRSVEPSIEAIKELGEACSCGAVNDILSESLIREACAEVAMTLGSESATLGTESGKRKFQESGRGRTRKRSSKQETGGGWTKKTGEPSRSAGGSRSTGSVQKNTGADMTLSQAAAGSAESIKKTCAWITAMIREQSGGCSANNAIRRLVFLEILKRALTGHSDTCEAPEKFRISGNDLQLVTPPDDWKDPAVLRKANPNFGISVSEEFLLKRQQDAIRYPSRQNSFLTKHLNVWVSARTAWLNMAEWHAVGDPSLRIEDFLGQPCWLGVDLASKTDIAAIALLFRDEIADKKGRPKTRWTVFVRSYLPEGAVERASTNKAAYETWVNSGDLITTDGEELDFDVIREDIKDLASQFEIQEIAYDPWRATQLAHQLMSDGAEIVEFRNTVQNMSPAMREMEAAITGGRWRHPCDPVLTWMASNVVARSDAKDNIYPRKEKAENKIDGIIAILMALGRAVLAEGEEPEQSIYDTTDVTC